MNFGRMNDNYYQPADDRAWDAFYDQYDPDEHGEDMDAAFEVWMEEQEDRAEDARISAAEYARDNWED